MAVELRGLNSELRASDDGGQRQIRGYAAVFGITTQIGGPVSAGGGFKERVDAHAFDSCLKADPDVRALFNHDPNFVLGRTKSGTLKLSTDNIGLRYEVKLPASSLGDSVFESVRRKDISGSSFGFTCRKDAWDHDTNVRTLLDCDLVEVSAVVFPAYGETSVSIRNKAGTMEMVKIGWYRAGKLTLSLSQGEMGAKVKALRRELRQDDDENECDCDCESCRDGDCGNCICESTDCTGTNCSSDGSEDCHCFTTREVQGRMQVPQGRTIAPVDRWLLQEQREVEQKLFDARQMMKWLK